MVVAKLKMMIERTKTFCPERSGASFLIFCKEAERLQRNSVPAYHRKDEKKT